MIIIDDRVGAIELTKHLYKHEYRVERLQFADAMWVGNGADDVPMLVGVERKTIGDLLACIVSGRLSGHQLSGLLNSYNFVYLIVEGEMRHDRRSGLLQTKNKYGRWTNACVGRNQFVIRDVVAYVNTLLCVAGVNVLRTLNIDETASVLLGLNHWWTVKEWGEHRAHLKQHVVDGRVELSKHTLVRRFAAQLDGVGYDRAKAVDGHFKSVREMVGADVDAWQEIPGIGKTLAKRIVEEMG